MALTMDIDEVDSILLEPFNLHTEEPMCHHSPSDYLSANFKFYPTDQEEETATAKSEPDVDALWTRAVDNMFKSSRLFNGSLEEEKENLAENLIDNVITTNTGVETTVKGTEKEVISDKLEHFTVDKIEIDDSQFVTSNENVEIKPQFEAVLSEPIKKDIVPTEPIKKDFIAAELIKKDSNSTGALCTQASTTDQIVPIAAKPRKKSAKRKFQDLDVNFDLIVSSSMPPSATRNDNKKFKLDDNRNVELADFDVQDGWAFPPKDCTPVEYSFDTTARLPSFREAFVPAIKRISMKVKELKKKHKKRCDSLEKQVALGEGHPKTEKTPVPFSKKNPQGAKGGTGGHSTRPNANPADLLSQKVSELNTLETKNLVKDENVVGNLGNLSNSEHTSVRQNDIKQEKSERFSQCDKSLHEHNLSTETPSKFLGLNSASLKDIEKDIFSFDEGLEMLDLDKDFSLQSITGTSLLDSGVSNDLTNHNNDWSFSLSHVPDVHSVSNRNGPSNVPSVPDKEMIGGNFMPSEKQLPNPSLLGSKAAEIINNSGFADLGLVSNTQSSAVNNFVQSRPLNGMDMINIDTNGLHMGLQQECAPQPRDHNGFNVLGHMQQQLQQQQNELQEAEQNNMNNLFAKDFRPELKPGPMNQQNFRNVNSIDGQIIAQQIHQSFGADVFGSPSDNGAKILAKYLAQRGSIRPGDTKPKISVTSAIASLIGKSFDEQEANQKMSRESSSLDFISAPELEHLDFMNENF